MTYNKSRHLELFKRFLDFQKQGKHLQDENQDEYLELLDYRCASEEHVFWKSRRQFTLLMENFINDSIDAEELSDSFSGLHRKTVDAHDTFEIDFEKLEDFQPDPRSNGFGSLMTFVYRECEGLEEEYYTKEQFKDLVRDVMPKIQQYL